MFSMSDLLELTPRQKAAVVITALGTDNAAGVYKHLSNDEVETLTLDVSSLPYLDATVADSVLNEFYELCLTQKVITDGGVEYARDVLTKAFGEEAAARLMSKITKTMQSLSLIHI